VDSRPHQRGTARISSLLFGKKEKKDQVPLKETLGTGVQKREGQIPTVEKVNEGGETDRHSQRTAKLRDPACIFITSPQHNTKEGKESTASRVAVGSRGESKGEEETKWKTE